MMVSQEFIAILQYLLPGFVAAWIFYGLTSYQRPLQFERVVQALIFTLIIEGLTVTFSYYVHFFSKYPWILSLMLAMILGIGFAFCVNTNIVHTVLQKCRITQENAFPTEWFGAFTHQETKVVLNFYDRRRLIGFLRLWPSHPQAGHFLIFYPC